MRNNHEEYVERVIARDTVATENLAALEKNWDRHEYNSEVPDTARFFNVRQWLVKAALRRHRKASVEGHAHFNNGLTLGLSRVKARSVNGGKK
jgi:hypothetical protein